MRTLQLHLTAGASIESTLRALQPFAPGLVLCFGDPVFFHGAALHAALKGVCPQATLAGCSGAGEILQHQVHDGTLALTALKFDAAQARGASTRIAGMADSFGAG